MKRKQEERRNIERMKRDEVFGTKIKCIEKYWRGILVTVTTASNFAKEAGDLVSVYRIYSNRRSRKDKYDCDVPITVSRVHVYV